MRAVERLTWPLGRRSLVAMLRGSVSAPPSARASLAFGILEAASDAEVKRWLKALEAAGALVEVETDDGYRVLQAVPGAALPSLGPKSGGPVDDSVVERLRSWRLERSREDGVPAYVVLHDATLRDLAAARPASLHELAAVKGFGPTKIERYGDDVLALRRCLQDPDERRDSAAEGRPAAAGAARVAFVLIHHKILYALAVTNGFEG